MKLSLKGSRQAILQLETSTWPDTEQLPTTNSEAENAAASSSAASTSLPEVTASGSGTTYYIDDKKDGDQFCIAEQLSEFPPHFYSELPEAVKKGWLADRTHYLEPASLDFAGIGTTVWGGFLSGGQQLVLYANGAAKQVRDGGWLNASGKPIYGLEEVFEGSWERDSGRGLILRLKTIKPGDVYGHRYLECKGGTMVTHLRSKTCSLAFQCKTWFEKLPDQVKEMPQIVALTEWSKAQVIPQQLKWTKLNAPTR